MPNYVGGSQTNYTGGEKRPMRSLRPGGTSINSRVARYESMAQPANNSGSGKANQPNFRQPTGRVKQLERGRSRLVSLDLRSSSKQLPKTPESKNKPVLANDSTGKGLARRSGVRAVDLNSEMADDPAGNTRPESANISAGVTAQVAESSGKGEDGDDIMEINSDHSSQEETIASGQLGPAVAHDTTPTRTRGVAPAATQRISPSRPSNVNSMISGFGASYPHGTKRLLTLDRIGCLPKTSSKPRNWSMISPATTEFGSVVSSLRSRSEKEKGHSGNGGNVYDDDDNDFASVSRSNPRTQGGGRRSETTRVHGSLFSNMGGLKHEQSAVNSRIGSTDESKWQRHKATPKKTAPRKSSISSLNATPWAARSKHSDATSSKHADIPASYKSLGMTFALISVQFGKYHQSSDPESGNPEDDVLKLVLRSSPARLEITGIRYGQPKSFTKLNVEHIKSIEYNEKGDSGIMRIAPKDTIESIFDEDTFNPSSSDPSLNQILIRWPTKVAAHTRTVSTIIDDLKGQVDVSRLDITGFNSCLSNIVRPESVYSLSSDDEHVDIEKCSDDIPQMPASNLPSLPAEARSRRKSEVRIMSYNELLYGQRDSSSPAHQRRKTTMSLHSSAGTGIQDSRSKSSYNFRKSDAYSLAEVTSVEEACNVDACSSDEDSEHVVALRRKYRSAGHVHLFEYPFGGHKRISVTGSDICRLFKDEFLNDTIIDFYMRYISENLRQTNPELYEQCFFFNTFFFRKLLHLKKGVSANVGDGSVPIEYEQLMKWTANANLLDRRYIFIPINENIHWYLVIITNPHLLLNGAADLDSKKTAIDRPEQPKSEPDTSDVRDNDGSPAEETDNLPDEAILACDMFRKQKRSADVRGMQFPLRTGEEADKDSGFRQAADSKVAPVARSASTNVIDKAPHNAVSSPILPIEQPELARTQPSFAIDDNDDSEFSYLGRAKAKEHSGSSRSLPADVIDLCSPQRAEASAGNRHAASATSMQDKESETVSLKFAGKTVEVPESRYVNPVEKPSILILDSLGNKHQRTITLLRSYMKAEAMSKHRVVPSVIPTGKYVKVPLQGNLCDCGVFLLNYIEQFLKQPRDITELALNGFDMRSWFVPATMKGKRKDIF
ncbi:hypothetical protein IWW45_006506, partial [Coemansia sp. RSA 485]